MDVDRLFEKIHDIYESHDGGAIYLLKEEEEAIKKILCENHSIADALISFNTPEKRTVSIIDKNIAVFTGEVERIEWDVDQWSYVVDGEWRCQSEIGRDIVSQTGSTSASLAQQTPKL